MALGHCICDVQQPCPCDQFKHINVCHCAGEQPPIASGPVRLTEHVRNAGCASKINKVALKQILAGLPEIDDPRVVVGASAGDDAGVIMLSKDTSTILTVDVFSPSVDDPYAFGQIAAANSVSDIYAMGGTPQAALSIIGFPVHSLPPRAMHDILRGGLDKMKEAGVPVVGGHSINDEEVKCGFAVVGTSPAGRFIRNAGAQVGDAIVLTKPLGGGIMALAHQVGLVDDAQMRQAAASMATLNKLAGELLLRLDAHAATDVTGFSLIGHMAEIVRNSDIEATIDFDALPLFDGVAELARQEVLPGAVERNREAVEESLLDLSQLTPAQQAILFCPETSGGLLVFLSQDAAREYTRRLQVDGIAARIVGKATQRCEGGRIRAVTARAQDYGPVPLRKARPAGIAAAPESAGSCCCDEQTPDPPAAEALSCCESSPRAETSAALSDNGLPAPAGAAAFQQYLAAVGQTPALGLKANKLISLALSVMGKCEPCVKINARAARDAGASEREIAETVSLGIAFGGAPVAMFYSAMRK